MPVTTSSQRTGYTTSSFNSSRSTGQRRIEELAGIELRNNAELTQFTQRAVSLAHDLSNELDWAGHMLEANLAHIKGIPIVNKVKARLVAQHLYFAASGMRIVGEAIVKCRASFYRHFAPELETLGGRGQQRHTFEIVNE